MNSLIHGILDQKREIIVEEPLYIQFSTDGSLEASTTYAGKTFAITFEASCNAGVFWISETSNTPSAWCDLLETVDLTNFSSPRISYFHGNSNLQNINYRVFTRAPYILNHQDCSLTTACIDDILQKSYDWFNANTPTTNYSLNLSGGNSAKPSINGSTNIANLEAIFIAASQSLNILVN